MSEYYGAIAIIVAAAAIWQQMWAAKRDRLRAFEDNYVQRYWTISDRWSLEVLREDTSFITDSDRLAIRAYIQLCEDEWDIRRLGWIGSSTWHSWASAIKQNFKNPVLSAVWEEVKAETSADPVSHREERFSGLRRLLEDAALDIDPRRRLGNSRGAGSVQPHSRNEP